MLRHKPKFKYSGLTIVLSQPSRFDRKELLTGVGGYFFDHDCLAPQTNRHCCDIRLAEDNSPLLDDTKCILLLGAKALSIYNPNGILSLDEQRGNPFLRNNIPCIATFSPQDAVDLRDYESKYNENITGEEESEDGESVDEVIESKGRGRTARSNYRFWVKNDVKKALKIVENGGMLPKLYFSEPHYFIKPDADFVCESLLAKKDEFLYFDMETDFMSMDMRCFSYSFSSDPFNIFCVPFLDTNYQPAYGHKTANIYRALAISVFRNCLVAHNGAQFDYLILAHKYKIAVKKVYDTLVAQHRIYPTVEKSLGHCISLATYEPFHKNEGDHTYRTAEQAQRLYHYCGKDVFGMSLVHRWQEEQMSKDEGLKKSIELAQSSIVPYLTASYTGMHYSEAERITLINEDDRYMAKYMEIMRILTGPDVKPLISSKKTVDYFHTMLGYPVVLRTKKNEPSLSKDAIFKLALKVNNPVLQFLIKYREVKKEIGTLNFKPWIE